MKLKITEEQIIEESVHILEDKLILECRTSFTIDDIGDILIPLLKFRGCESPTLDKLKKPAKILIEKGYEFEG